MKLPFVLLLLLAFPWTAIAAGPASFLDFRDYLIGSTPLSVSLADVNNDSYPDAIVGSYGGTLVLLGRPDGTFAPPIVVQRFLATSVAVADFNHDGNLDIASLGSSNGSLVNLAFGNGNGTFQPARKLPIDCTNCQSMTTGDFNNDGKPDLAVATISYVAIYLNIGNDHLFVARPPTYPVTYVVDMMSGDVDKDGNTDLIVSDFGEGTLVVMKGDGRGVFTPTSYPFGSTPFQAVLTDLNGDSWPDLVSPDRDSNMVQVRLNLGNGMFGSMSSYDAACSSYTSSCSLQGIASGDFNKDGKVDIATPGSILYGNGNGTLQAPAPFVAGALSKHLAAADFNRDGNLDLIVTNEAGINLSVLFGGYQPVQQPASLAVGSHPKAIVTGDFNGDGKADIAVAVNAENQVKVFLSTGDGGFTPAPALTATAPGALVAQDFNHDSKLDLAISGYYGTWIYLGRGDGTFQPAAQYSSLIGDCTPSGLTDAPSPCFASADFNNDSIPDLIGALWINGVVSMYLGNGDGTFREGTSFVLSDLPQSIVAADFNKDSKADLIIGSYYGVVYVYPGRGNGTFGLPLTMTIGPPGAALSVGDVDSDGNLDLVYASAASSSSIGLSVSVLFGKGNLLFTKPLTLLADMSPNAAVLADFNNDGLVDIATPNREAGDVAIFINNGNRTFQPAILYGAGISPSEIISADLNGDLKRDIVIMNSYSDASILFNTTP